MKFIAPLFSIALAFSFTVNSQSNAHSLEIFEYARFQNYTMQNGLPSDFTFKCVQAKDNAIWVATLHGIARFNGFRWEYFLQESIDPRKRMPSNWVMDIEMGKNLLWYHTDRGVGSIRLNDKSVLKSKNPHEGWGKITINGDNIFASTWLGIYEFKNKYGRLVSPKHLSNSSYNFTAKLFSNNDKVYAIQNHVEGLFVIDKANLPRKKRKIRHLKTFTLDGKKERIHFIEIKKYGNAVYALTRDFGIIRIDLETAVAIRSISNDLLKHYNPKCLQPYRVNNELMMLVGTNNSGLLVVYLRNKKVLNIKSQLELPTTSLTSDVVNDLYVDKSNGVWISTDKGISYFHPSNQQFKAHYFFKDSDVPDHITVNAACEISPGTFLIGTDQNGLFLYDAVEQSTEMVLAADSHTDLKNVTSICPFSPKKIIISSRSGVYEYDVSKKRTSKITALPSQAFIAKKVSTTAIGIGSFSGVVIWDIYKKKVTYSEKLQKGQEKGDLSTNDLFYDTKYGYLWCIRGSQGLQRVAIATGKGKFVTPDYEMEKGIDFHNISYSVKDNELYISSTDGIYVHNLRNPNRRRIIYSSNGLSGNFVERVLIDNETNTIYYTTPIGLYRYDEKKQRSFLIHTLEKYSHKFSNELTLSKNKHLIFSISNYFVHFALNKPVKTNIPTPTLEELFIENDRVDPSQPSFSVKANERNMKFIFSSPFFIRDKECVLEYQLHPLSDVWHGMENGQINLIGLNPDDYSLVVRWKNQTTGETSNYFVKHILVNKPFYATWWFLLLSGSFIGVILYFYYWIRLKSKESLINTRMSLSRDLHDELGANVSSIHIMSSILKANISESDANRSYVNMIDDYSKQITETVNDIIWNVNPRFDTMQEVVMRMMRYAMNTLEAKGIITNFYTDEISEKQVIRQDIKYHIYLIFKEAINNCAKYSNATNVLIRVSVSAKELSCSIEDNGIGFDIEKMKKAGNGITNMQHRANEIKASLFIQSIIKKGTLITLKKTL